MVVRAHELAQWRVRGWWVEVIDRAGMAARLRSSTVSAVRDDDARNNATRERVACLGYCGCYCLVTEIVKSPLLLPVLRTTAKKTPPATLMSPAAGMPMPALMTVPSSVASPL